MADAGHELVFDRLLSASCVLALRALLGLLYLVTNTYASDSFWFAPRTTVDFMELFHRDSAWQKTAAGISVFQLYGSYVKNADVSDLRVMLADLRRRGIKISLETGVISGPPPREHPICGGWGLVEGYGTVDASRALAKKIKDAGGWIDYIAMDEPLYYGHFYVGSDGRQPGCHTPVAQLIEQVTTILEIYEHEFPGLTVGQIEPTDMLANSDWQEAYREWVTLLLQRRGRPLGFLHIDAQWHDAAVVDRIKLLSAFARQLIRERYIEKLGMIYNGIRSSANDRHWSSSALKHKALVEREAQFCPDRAIVQSWHKNYPMYSLPEDSHNTLTGLALQVISQPACN